MYKLLLILAIVIGFGTHAEARHAHHHRYHHHYHHAYSHKRIPVVRSVASTTVLPHPSGCPQVAFCGCGASIEVFHENIRRLWVAAEWYSFPRAEPAPGMVAVTRHHVAVLKEHIQGSVWLVIDHNGGHHMSFLHPRSIAGTTIVNPHGDLSHVSTILSSTQKTRPFHTKRSQNRQEKKHKLLSMPSLWQLPFNFTKTNR